MRASINKGRSLTPRRKDDAWCKLCFFKLCFFMKKTCRKSYVFSTPRQLVMNNVLGAPAVYCWCTFKITWVIINNEEALYSHIVAYRTKALYCGSFISDCFKSIYLVFIFSTADLLFRTSDPHQYSATKSSFDKYVCLCVPFGRISVYFYEGKCTSLGSSWWKWSIWKLSVKVKRNICTIIVTLKVNGV